MLQLYSHSLMQMSMIDRLREHLHLLQHKKLRYLRDFCLYYVFLLRRYYSKRIDRFPVQGSVTIVITSAGRKDHLRATIEALKKNLMYDKELVRWAIIDDAPDSKETRDYILSQDMFDTIILNKKNYGLGYSLNKIYNTVSSEFVLHYEDDWVLLRPLELAPILEVLQHSPNICQMILARERIKSVEYPGATVRNDSRYAEYAIRVFALNPHVMRMELHQNLLPFPLNLSHSGYMQKVQKLGKMINGVWEYGKEPLVRHIGDYRHVCKRY